jgi:hypothetical protein
MPLSSLPLYPLAAVITLESPSYHRSLHKPSSAIVCITVPHAVMCSGLAGIHHRNPYSSALYRLGHADSVNFLERIKNCVTQNG